MLATAAGSDPGSPPLPACEPRGDAGQRRFRFRGRVLWQDLTSRSALRTQPSMTQAVGVRAGSADWLPKLIFRKRQELIDDRERGRMTLVGVRAQRIHHSSANDFDGQKGRCLGLSNWPLAVRAQPATPSRRLKLLRPFAQALGSNALDLHRTAAPDDLRGAFPQVLAPAVIDRVVVAAHEGCNRGTNRFRMVAERLTTQHRGEFDDAHPMPGRVVSTWAQVYRGPVLIARFRVPRPPVVAPVLIRPGSSTANVVRQRSNQPMPAPGSLAFANRAVNG